MIDVHAHYVPECLLSEMAASPLSANGATMTASAEGDVWFVDVSWEKGGRTMRRTFPIRPEHRRVETRLQWMESQGVTAQVISLLPHLHGYFLPAEVGVMYAQKVNSHLHGASLQAPGRLLPMAHLPWQAPAEALAELNRVADLGFTAVLAGSKLGPRRLDDPVFAPVLARIAELGMLLFIHPVDISAEAGTEDYYLVNLIDNPVDTAVAAARLVFSGTLDRHPTLRICLAHGGGAAPALAGRWDHGYDVRKECRGAAQRPSAYFRRLYFDTVVHHTDQLEWLCQLVGPTQVLLGTDCPADMGDLNPSARLARLEPSTAARIAHENFAALLGGVALARNDEE